MSAATVGEAVRQQIADLYRRRAFQPISRFLRGEDHEDRLQEGIALTLQMALRRVAGGQRLPDAILVHHCRLRATDRSRHLVSSKGRGLDAMNQALFVDGKVEVLHFSGVADDDCSEGDRQLTSLAVRGNTDPSETLASAFDLGHWLAALPDRDRRLLELRAAGNTLQEIATEVGMSMSQVFAHIQRLGSDLAQAMGVLPPKRPRRQRA